ncbi:transposase [Campylobacter showae]|uniref:transposase n=1 Tax=Campylobacter showae TaxID=204 RepID=UPI0013D4BE62
MSLFYYPMDIRKEIYTTNTIKSLHLSLRKLGINQVFPYDDSIYKMMYLEMRNASKYWTISVRN